MSTDIELFHFYILVHLWVYKTGFEDVTKAKRYLLTNEVFYSPISNIYLQEMYILLPLWYPLTGYLLCFNISCYLELSKVCKRTGTNASKTPQSTFTWLWSLGRTSTTRYKKYLWITNLSSEGISFTTVPKFNGSFNWTYINLGIFLSFTNL